MNSEIHAGEKRVWFSPTVEETDKEHEAVNLPPDQAAKKVELKQSYTSYRENEFPPSPLGGRRYAAELCYCWLNSWLYKNLSGTLDEDDVFDVPRDTESRRLVEHYEHLKQQFATRSGDFTLIRAFFAMFMLPWILAALLYVAWCFFAGAQPLLLRSITEFLEDESAETKDGIVLAVLLFLFGIGYTYSINWEYHLATRIGVCARSLLISLLHDKALLLNISGSEGGIGVLVNMVSNDVDRIFQAIVFLHYVWLSPIFLLWIMGMMYRSVGIAGLVGFGVLFLLVPTNAYISQRIGEQKRKLSIHADTRTNIMQQAFSGIHILKSLSMENLFKTKIVRSRNLEMEHVKWVLIFEALLRCVQFSFPSLVSFITLAIYVALGNTLTLPIAIETLAYINIAYFPLLVIPKAASMLVQALVSIKRIENFLARKEVQVIGAVEVENPKVNEDDVLVVEDCSYIYKSEAEENENTLDGTSDFCLKGLQMRLKKGSLTGIIGPVGSGKTTLLKALLGELKSLSQNSIWRRNPKLVMPYLSQTPSIINATLKSNILYGLEYESNLYRRCIDSACLEEDIRLLPWGDETEIGEQGVNLSGGQRARVCFARVLYHAMKVTNDSNDSPICLFDDPLSAVDVHVANRMFNSGLVKDLKKSTRVIVVSSHLELLRNVDQIIILGKQGNIRATGKWNELTEIMNLQQPSLFPHAEVADSVEKEQIENHGSDYGTNSELTPESRRQKGKIIVAETRETGRVSFQVIKAYYDMVTGRKDGVLMIVVMLLSYAVGQALRVFIDLFIAWWASFSEQPEELTSTLEFPSFLTGLDEQSEWISVLGILVLFNTLFAGLRSFVCVFLAVKSSRTLFEKCLDRVMNAPLSYFYSNPVGRLLNRLSGDMDKVDLLLPNYLYDALDNVFILASVFIVAAMAVPFTLLMFIPVILSFHFITRLYRVSSREVMRMDAISRSPINSFFAQSIETRETIRAFKMSNTFREYFLELVNKNARHFLMVNILQRWDSIITNLVGNVLIGAILVVGVLFKDKVPAAVLSLSFVYALRFMGLSSVTIMNLVLFENQLTSAERVQELLTVPQESPRQKESDPDPDSWPSDAKIEIRNLRLRYRNDLPLVLKDVTVTINSKEKVGICGRTGSGKTSIMRALLRLFEPEEGSGILIDGINTGEIGLDVLRGHAITIIPQEPIVYNGTIRDNLDPEGVSNDADIWKVLQEVNLATRFNSLEFNVGDNGSLLSHGERQLLVICRAVLRKCKILLVDEATSSVDEETDSIVQGILRQRFKDCTVLTIAHRLQTIMDNDRILVLDNGSVSQFDTPANLLLEYDGIFAQMARNAGILDVQIEAV